MLGPASAAMTLDTYADFFEDDLDYVAEALSRVSIRRGRLAKRLRTILLISCSRAPLRAKQNPRDPCVSTGSAGVSDGGDGGI